MISSPSDIERELIFHALAKMIEANSGAGFINGDQGHPAYTAGVSGSVDEKTWGDGPETNVLFQLLASFEPEFHQEGPDLSTWQKFCTYAVKAYNDTHEPR